MNYFCFILIIVTAVSNLKAQVTLPPIVPPFDVNVNGTPALGHLFTTAINMLGATSSWPSTLLLMDENGDLIYYLPVTNASSAPYPRKAVGDFKLHVDGRMSFTDALFGVDSSIYIMDSTFQVIDTLRCTPGYKLDGHDFQITNDGHYHLLALEERIMDASALTTESGQVGDVNCTVTGHIIQEFDANKNLVREWKSLDHFALTDTYEYYFLDSSNLEHVHINSLFVDYEGNYIISSRSLNEITRINRLTGQIIWRLGGINNEFTLLGDTLLFTAQHDAQYYSDGTVVFFDNATYSYPDLESRILVYQMDTVAMTVTPNLNFKNPLNLTSNFMGNAQTLDSNHFILSWGGGYDYNLGISIQEFDGSGHEIFEVDFEPGFAPYRAVKSILPWTINRPKLVCDGVNMTLSTFQSHATYYWNTGDTTSTITISALGSYQVWTDAGQGFLSSEIYEVTDLNDLCQLSVGLSEIQTQDLSIFPNPTQDVLKIKTTTFENVTYTLYDPQGKLVLQDKLSGEITRIKVNRLAPGGYTLVLKNETQNLRTFKVVKTN
jgi:hypothetical protein